MVHFRLAFAVTAATLLRAVTADSSGLSIVVPGGADLWWVGDAQNNIVWTCQTSPFSNFTVLIANQDPKVLASAIAVIAIENNYDCSKTIIPDQSNLTAATGYVVQFANTLNETDVYAQSQPFEIKAPGSAYPDPSATPSASGTSTGTASTAPTASSSSNQKGIAAPNAKLSTAGLGLAAIGALLGFMA